MYVYIDIRECHMLSGLICGFHIVKAIALLYRCHRFTYMVGCTDRAQTSLKRIHVYQVSHSTYGKIKTLNEWSNQAISVAYRKMHSSRAPNPLPIVNNMLKNVAVMNTRVKKQYLVANSF